MREILFRGKSKDNGEWVEGHYFTEQIAKGSNPCVDISIIKNDLHEDFEVNPKTICQFTGLTDKNGKRVFEGDVIRCEQWHPSTYKVIFDKGEFCFQSLTGIESPYTNSIHYVKHFEIIGNIHEKEVNNG